MTVEDIYKRLEAGESDKTIAEELINMLNEALDMRDKNEAKRVEEAQKVAEVLNAYFTTYCDYPACLTGEDIATLGKVLKNTEIKITDEPHRKGIKIKTTSGGPGFNPDEIIGDFLDAFKLR